jgi:hypothetical protein
MNKYQKIQLTTDEIDEVIELRAFVFCWLLIIVISMKKRFEEDNSAVSKEK